MIKKKYFSFIMGLWIMFALAITMSVVVLLLNTGKLALIPIIISTLEAFIINLISSLIIPANKLGEIFAKKFNAKENSFLFSALSNFIVSGIYVTIVSFFMTVINVGVSSILFVAWISIYPIVFIVGYIVSLIFAPFALKLTTKIVER
ncbi:hypothetical protein B0P06_002974 [Clostridium saccharoperbutylacetonicum]|nr:DUF2798 domain-containing protein [Clostridium saccharoperbutylacetonicum]NRT60513.1 hypothetical protein [Clostridium saccharoperbutylacetonicum]NSB23827.1 hypothetical protein [Clostridium saccharoperbutylacetonicum]NSB43203.1 hypothetical protein [Clostridium saccharoperbutylacetonicum]